MTADPQAGLDFTAGRYVALVAEKNALTERMGTALAAVKRLHCTCWEPDRMEQEGDKCDVCVAKDALLGVVPEAPDYDHNADWVPPEFLDAPLPLDDRNSR